MKSRLILFAVLAIAIQATAQIKPVNDLPTPYETVENYFKLPAGRIWGAISAIEVDKDGKSYEELKAELMRLAKEERLDYGIMIKASNPGGNSPVGTPVLTYRVKVSDGKEELVRVGGASGLTVQGLRHIVAVGNDSIASNRLVGTSGAETATSIVAPSVLVEEISLDKPSGTQNKPALMTNPFFSN